MENNKLLETVADISYIAGFEKHYSGNSRFDIEEYIFWAHEFEKTHENTDWTEENYMILIDEFVRMKLNKEERNE